MLKGKKGLYLLFPIVILIWGTIIYRLVDAFSAKEEKTMQTAMIRPMKIPSLEREKFTIGAVERDPFLGTIYRPAAKKTIKKTSTLRKKDTLMWPSVRYKGLVTDKTTGKAVYIIEVNGMTQLLKQEQAASGVTLKKGNKTSVVMIFKGASKQFLISN